MRCVTAEFKKSWRSNNWYISHDILIVVIVMTSCKGWRELGVWKGRERPTEHRCCGAEMRTGKLTRAVGWKQVISSLFSSLSPLLNAHMSYWRNVNTMIEQRACFFQIINDLLRGIGSMMLRRCSEAKKTLKSVQFKVQVRSVKSLESTSSKWKFDSPVAAVHIFLR